MEKWLGKLLRGDYQKRFSIIRSLPKAHFALSESTLKFTSKAINFSDDNTSNINTFAFSCLSRKLIQPSTFFSSLGNWERCEVGDWMNKKKNTLIACIHYIYYTLWTNFDMLYFWITKHLPSTNRNVFKPRSVI